MKSRVKLGTEYEIRLNARDMKGSRFSSLDDCPINRAVRRRFNWRYKVRVNYNAINMEREDKQIYRGLRFKTVEFAGNTLDVKYIMEGDLRAMKKRLKKFPNEEIVIKVEEAVPGSLFIQF